MRYLTIIFLLVFASAGLTHKAMAQVAQLQDWHKLANQHFILYTDYDLETAKDVVEKMTIFRTVILQFLKGADKHQSQPLTMVMFRDYDMWRDISISKGIGGYFTFPIYGPLAVVAPRQDKPNISTIFHEYVHYLVNRYVPVRYPDWYNEGMAEFFSTLAIEDEYVYIGAVPKYSAKALERFGLLRPNALFSQSQIIQLSNKEKAKFYPSAWLTAHYFTLGGRNGFTSHYKSNVAFMDAVRNGTDIDDAFEQSFDISMAELHRELRLYARSTSKNGFAIDRPQVNTQISVKKLNSAEIAAQLATVYGWRDKDSIGARYLQSAVEQQDPFAMSVHALHLVIANDSQAALRLLNKLPPLEQLDARTLHNVFRTNQIMAKHSADAGEKTRALSQRDSAEKALSESLQRAPYMPSLMDWVKLMASKNNRADTLEAVQELLNYFDNHAKAQLTASQAFLQFGEPQQAFNSINQALHLIPHDSNSANLLAQLRQQLDKISARLKK